METPEETVKSNLRKLKQRKKNEKSVGETLE